MKREEYIKKAMTILGEHIYGCNVEDCHCDIPKELEALYQLHLEGVREELDIAIQIAKEETDSAAYDDEYCESEDCHFDTSLGDRIVEELEKLKK